MFMLPFLGAVTLNPATIVGGALAVVVGLLIFALLRRK